MIDSLYSGRSGLVAESKKMNVVSNNIVNVNTNGFKSSSVVLTDAFNNTLQQASAATDSIGGTNPMQTGTGVMVGAINVNMSSNTSVSTGRALDAAINGDGYFSFLDNAGANVYSRVGNFAYSIGTDNKLVDASTGDYVLDSSGQKITIDPKYTNVSIDKNGNIIGTDTSNGDKKTTIATLKVVNFPNSEGLDHLGNGMYAETANSGPASSSDTVAGKNGTGLLRPGCLESSNVDLAKEFSELITAQRGYQASARVMTTSDTFLEELINLKRS